MSNQWRKGARRWRSKPRWQTFGAAWKSRASCTRCRNRWWRRSTARPPAPGFRSRWPAISASPLPPPRSPPPSPRSACPVLTAQEALALGIVTRVVPDAEVESAAHELAMSLAQGPSVTLGYIKRNINNAEHLSLEACFDAEAIHHTRAGETADHKEAAKAFVEKRKPVFQGH